MIASHAIATAGQWRHVVGVSDPASTRVAIYVDGVKDAELTVTVPSIAAFPTPFRIGDDAVTGKKVKGVIDDVRIYNRALSVAEVQALYDEAAQGAETPTKILWSSTFEKDDAQYTLDSGIREPDDIFGAKGFAIKSKPKNDTADGYFTSVIGLRFGTAPVLGSDSWIRFACRTQGATKIALQSFMGEGMYEKYIDLNEGDWQWVSFKMSEYERNVWQKGPPLPKAGMPFTNTVIFGVGNKKPTTVWIANVTVGDGPMPQVKVEARRPAPEQPVQAKTHGALSECFALLAKGQGADALASARKDPSLDGQAVVRVLERAKSLWEQAIANLTKKPPAEPVDVPKMKLSGVILRIEGNRAIIKSQGVEVPVDIGLLPHAVMIKTLALDESKPDGLADKAAFLFAEFDMEGLKGLLPRLDRNKFPDIYRSVEAWLRQAREK
jgi:hypothetical protein